MKLLACNSNKLLAQEIAKYLSLKLVDAEVKTFADHEIFVEIKENVRGEDIFVIQSTSYPANDHIMELLIAIDALRRVFYHSNAGGIFPECARDRIKYRFNG